MVRDDFRICVIGLGYVGLPLALAFGEKFKTLGFDINKNRIKELQKKLKELSNEELENTFWEIETGEFVNNNQIKDLEQERDQMIESLNLNNKDNVHKVLMDFCKKYEELCIVKYPDAPLPLEILKSTGS